MTTDPEPAPFDWSALESAARSWVRESPRAREVVRLLAECLQRSLLDSTAEAGPPAPSQTRVEPSPPPAAPALPAEKAAQLLREALRPRATIESAPAESWSAEDADLSLVARRARLKAQACRWSIERRRRTKDGTWGPEELQEGLQALIAKAKALPDCYLWMVERDRWLPDEAGLEQLAAAFDNLALALEIEVSIPANGAQPEDLDADMLALVAECQSALRAALRELPDPVEDREQFVAFHWLKAVTRSRQVYVERHMRLDDPASPADWYERGRRLAAKQEALEKHQSSARERTQAFNKLRYHARRIHEAAPDADVAGDWSRVFDTVDRLLAIGIKASSKELRELVLPIVDRIPDGALASAGWEQVDRHVDEYLALQEAEHVEPNPVRQRTADVLSAAELLRGRRVVLIGGHERPRSREALVRELELGELVWITSREHESLDVFLPDVTHPATVVVILMIRWTSHSYGGVRKFCEEHGKLLVRLPGGYSPNQVAAQVLAQVGDRLRQQRRDG